MLFKGKGSDNDPSKYCCIALLNHASKTIPDKMGKLYTELRHLGTKGESSPGSHQRVRSYKQRCPCMITAGASLRCDVCDLPCSSSRGIKIHKARKHKSEKEQNFKGTLAAEAVQVCKLVSRQEKRPEIQSDGETLKNVFRFKYLETIFTADAKQKYDIKTRIAKAFSRF